MAGNRSIIATDWLEFVTSIKKLVCKECMLGVRLGEMRAHFFKIPRLKRSDAAKIQREARDMETSLI